MSKVDLNALLNGVSGKLGNAVLRKRKGRTTISQKPSARTTPATEKELAQRKRFKRATAYATARLQDPAAKAEYELMASRKEYMTAFTMAVTDFLKLPEMDEVITDRYKGNVGDVIVISVSDPVKIKQIHVTVLLPDGTLLEEGEAVIVPGEIDFTYTSTVANAQLLNSKIQVTATDRPGNKVTLEKIV